MESGINEIYKNSASCFDTAELAMLWRESDLSKICNRANYYVKNNKLLNPRRGIYCKKKFDIFELSSKIYRPSYISLMTVLCKEGVNYQFHSAIYAISYLSREITINNQEFYFKKIKDEILTNSNGIIQKDHYAIASVERAFLDTLYLMKEYYFDSLTVINWDKAFDLVKIYEKKSMLKTLNFWYQVHKEGEA